MKSKRRHHSSKEDSDDSDASDLSTSSDSESEESSASEHRHRKKKKRVDSSDTDSDSDDHRRSRKRKHKKKKKRHVKKKRRSVSDDDSRSDAENESSLSEGEVSPKKKRKKQKQRRSRSSSASVIEIVERKERRLHSVVKERRRSSEDEEERPVRTYYQKEYRSESPVDEYERQREREVQRFYRGSSKERRFHEENQYDERQRNERYEPYRQEVEHSDRGTIHQSSQFSVPTVDSQRGQRHYQCQRNNRYEGNNRHAQAGDEYQRRPREEPYHSREQPRGNNQRYNQYQERGPKRNFDERDRRGPPERYQEFAERRDRYREEPFQSERQRDVRRETREKPPGRSERPPPPQHHRNDEPRSVVTEDRYRDRNVRRPEVKEERNPEGNDRYRDSGTRREPRRDERRPERDRPVVKSEPRNREKKSRFSESEGNKEYSWGKTEVKKESAKDDEKEKPNFGLSGKLTADANTVNGVVIKYTEPDDAKQPKRRWRFYPFKGDKPLPILYIHRQSAFLIGRDKKVVDIALEHPSISKQHAALQYRATPFTRADGSQGRRVRPYVIDLESANGTFVNNKKIESRRYVELLEKDVVKFGFSQREYVLLHENSKDDAQDDDNQDPVVPAVTTTEQIKQEKRMKEETVEDGE